MTNASSMTALPAATIFAMQEFQGSVAMVLHRWNTLRRSCGCPADNEPMTARSFDFRGATTVLYGRRFRWQVTSFISGIEVRLQSYIRPTCADVSLCVAPMNSAEGSLI